MLNSSVIAKVVCKSRAGFVEEYHCRNHIRYVFEISGTIEVCGTGAYKPRTFELNRTDLSIIQEGGSTSGNGRCPFSPDNNSTAIYIETGNPGNASTIYTASFTDFGGSEPIFYRLSVGNSPFLRSKPNDKYIFLNPHFVRAFDVGDYVYLFFREQAAEEILSTRIYSRVARVCKADRGGASLLVNRWTTYSKVRLVCSDPGDITLYFDELHDVVYEEGIYYGVFTTTSKQRMFASAVCSFTEKRIADAFAGNYKNQESDDNIFNVVATSRVPSTRPSECSPDSQQLSIVVLQFASGHPFMATDVTSESGQALFSHDLIILHRIVVDIRKESKVFFIGSDQGKVYKVVQWTTPAKHHSETLAIWQPFKEVTHIWEMKLLGRRLYISTDDSIVEINVEQCDNYLCPQCVRDPYCDWSVASGNCTVRGTTLWTGSCNCTAPTSKHHVTAGDVAHFKCHSVCAMRRLSITWYTKNLPLMIDNNKYFLSSNNTLIITDVKPSDGASYICESKGVAIAEHKLIVATTKTTDKTGDATNGKENDEAVIVIAAYTAGALVLAVATGMFFFVSYVSQLVDNQSFSKKSSINQ